MAKVKYNINNAHYAVKSAEGDGYETPVALPGSVSLALEQQGELSPFYADGVKYWVSASNGGYEGDYELALIPDSFRTDVLGETQDTNKVLVENANATAKEFAFGFDITTDTGVYKFWFLNCTATRPSIEAQTNEDTIEPQTDTLTISCASNADGVVRVRTTDTTEEDTLTSWYTQVYEPQTSPAA